jgi:PAP2 superfamily
VVRTSAKAAGELGLMAALFLAYKAVRLAVAGRVAVAFDNAHHVLSLERVLHLDVEQWVQSVVLHSERLVVLINRYYVSMHFTTFVVFLLWLFVLHRDHYPHIRWLIVASTALALALHVVFPLAPPRMLPGFVDTMARFGPNAYASSAVASLANQHAAMPSVHFMWATIVAYGVIRASRSPLRWAAIAHPVFTLFAIVATANHYLFDAVVGGALLLVVLASETAITRAIVLRRPVAAPAGVTATAS